MALWHPFADSDLEDRMGRMFDRALSSRLGHVWPALESDDFLHAGGDHPMDVAESPTEYRICADAPGMDPADIDVKFKDNKLTISGERKEEARQEGDDGRWVKVERKERSFTRSFVLPKNADPDKIAARLDRGVLTVSVAKREVADEGAKKIEVTTG
ncbi:unnamed protein product [Ostreobium quekettii]|uniref:SHSP domain-containing protein n=1 Tax=Ostreobium quekettii TaxID=121088 RepID=A0A8S1J6S7_9CHLO|nr:unnamed protein product [Ostreobium quekettii]